MMNEDEKKIKKQDEVINEYNSQVNDEDDIHFEHVDWTYNDSSCC